MKRLEDIPKKTLFEVPEGYFDRLPGVIQARVASQQPESAWSGYGQMAVRFALPVVVIAAAAVFFLNNPEAASTEELLASIESEQLVAYLEETEVNTDDLLEFAPLEAEEVQALEEDAFGEYILEEIDLEELENEFDTTRN